MKIKRILLALLMVILLASCTEDDVISPIDNDNDYTINIDVKLHVSEVVEIEDSYFTSQLKEIVDIKSEYLINEVEILVSEFAIFPYESEFVENSSELNLIIQDFFNQVSDTDYIGGSGVSFDVGLKAKIIVSMSNNDSTIICEFFQNREGEILGSTVTYISEGIKETRKYSIDYQEFYDQLLEVVGK